MSNHEGNGDEQLEVWITTKVSKELHQQLIALASRNDRSVAAELRMALRDRLERESLEAPA